jgi:hypothetical protein
MISINLRHLTGSKIQCSVPFTGLLYRPCSASVIMERMKVVFSLICCGVIWKDGTFNREERKLYFHWN